MPITSRTQNHQSGGFLSRKTMEEVLPASDVKLAADLIRQLKASKFQDQSLATSMFSLLKRLFEPSDSESAPAVLGDDFWIPEQASQARKKAHEARLLPLNDLLIKEDFTEYLLPFLRDSNTLLQNNAAALIMLITNSFEHTRLHSCVAEKNFVSTLVKMIHHPVPSIQFWIIGILRNLARSEDFVKLIRQHNGIHPLVDILGSESLAKGIAASALANLAYDNEENRRIIAERGGIGSLVRVIASTTNKQVLWEATGALGNLSYKSEENKQRIVEAGGIQILVNLLGASSEDVVATAASTLENLCSNSEDYRVRCAELGAIPCLIELLKSKNEAVQDGSCGALFNLSINTDNRNVIVEKGAIPLVVELLCSSNDDVLYRATGVLHNVSCNNQAAAQLLDRNVAIPRIIELLASKNELIQENASGTLMNLGCVDTKAIEIADLGGVKSLVQLLSHSKNDQVVYRVCGALFNVCFGQTENAQRVVTEGGVKALLDSIRRSTHPKVMEYSLGTLGMLTQNGWATACPAIAQEGGINLILSQVLGEPRTHRILTEACGIVTALAEDPTIVVRHNFLPQLIHLMRTTRNDQLHPLLEGIYKRAQDTLRSHYLDKGIGVEADKPSPDLAAFEQLVNSPRYHDLVLVVQGHRFYAHKVILFGRSEYFRAMFDRWLHNIPRGAERRQAVSGNADESFYELPLQFDGLEGDDPITPDTFIELLRYLYTGRCTFTGNNIVPLLQLAGLYNETKLSGMCERELYDSATTENWLDVLHIAVQFSTKRLHHMIIAFAVCNIPLVELPSTCLPLLSDSL